MNSTKVIVTDYASVGRQSKSKGLNVHTCECGAHIWALPFNEGQALWQSYLTSPIRHKIDENGLAPPKPNITHHVVLASPEDAELVRSRRWRVYPSKAGTLHKVELRGGTRRGLPLQRHVMGRDACVRVVNRNGCDVRRENLRQMTRKEIAQERRPRGQQRKAC